MNGRMYIACMRSSMMYGNEAWAMKAENVQRMERMEIQMVRLTDGIKLWEKKRK